MTPDELEVAYRARRDAELLPDRLVVSDTCCLGACDLRAVRVSVWPPTPRPGALFEVFAFCANHAREGWD